MILYKLEFNFFELISNLLPYLLISVGFSFYGLKYLVNQAFRFKVLSILLLTISTIFLFIFIISLSEDIATYKQYINIINSKTFESISGSVNNFKPADLYGKGEESFDINGTKFSYSQYENHIGYHTVSTKGGIIKGNDQILTIDYIYDKYLDKNIILQISQ